MTNTSLEERFDEKFDKKCMCGDKCVLHLNESFRLFMDSELTALKTEVEGKKRSVNWQNIGSPESIAQQSTNYGHNEALDEVLKLIEKRRGV